MSGRNDAIKEVSAVQTKMWQGDRPEDISAAAECLKQGELVAFPTETVYGLGANALEETAAQKIYAAKGRPSDNPLIVHIYDKAQLGELVSSVPPKAEALMAAFWPGPLTLVLPRAQAVPDCVTGGLATVGIRMPDHPAALALLKACGLPLAAPSANTSGKPSPTHAEHVYHDLAGRIAGIIDGGPTTVGLESTVLDVTAEPPVILRPGGVTQEAIEHVIGPVEADTSLKAAEEVPKAPGMKYKHYAPEAAVVICQGTPEVIAGQLRAVLSEERRPLGLMISEETAALLGEVPPEVSVRILGRRSQPETLAHELFDALRWFDDQLAEVIYTESFPDEEIGAALMNRLQKAAGAGS